MWEVCLSPNPKRWHRYIIPCRLTLPHNPPIYRWLCWNFGPGEPTNKPFIRVGTMFVGMFVGGLVGLVFEVAFDVFDAHKAMKSAVAIVSVAIVLWVACLVIGRRNGVKIRW